MKYQIILRVVINFIMKSTCYVRIVRVAVPGE